MKIWFVKRVLITKIYDTSDWWDSLVNKQVDCICEFPNHYMIKVNGTPRGICKSVCKPTDYEFKEYPDLDEKYPYLGKFVKEQE